MAAAVCVGAFGVRARAMPGQAPNPTARSATPAAVRAATSDTVTQTQFRNVDFDVGSGIVLRIARLRGDMRSTRPGSPIVFDDKRSFIIHIATAQVGLTMESLDSLMNGYVFAYKGAPLRKLRFSTDSGLLVQKGILHKVVDIPFEIRAAMTLTPAGLIRLHPVSIRIFNVSGTGLMNALGIKLSGLLDLSKANGVSVEGNDLLLDPRRILPPPAIEGRVTAVHVTSDQVVQIFGDTSGSAGPAPLAPPDPRAANYMYFRGGTLRFGKLFMVQADMQIIDLNAEDPFDFSIDRYNTQLVAGYSRNTPVGGLEVFMPDLAKTDRGGAPRGTER